MVFSIIITAYNYEKYIEKSVKSAISQNFHEAYEVIVVDDCSTDKTPEVLNNFSSIIRINNKRNLGLETSVNKAINQSKGKYIVRLDADDYLANDFLSVVSQYIKDENTFYYGDYTTISESNLHLSKVHLIDFDKEEIECRGDFLATGTVYPRNILFDVGLYSEEVKNCGLENYQLVLKLIDRGFAGCHIKENLFFYRRHSGSLSSERFDSIARYGCQLAEQYGLNSYSVNQYHPYLNIADIDQDLLNYVKYIRK